MNTIFWDPSPDAGILQYEVESAPTVDGPWTLAATVVDAPRSALNAHYTAGPPAQFTLVDASGSPATWYRLRAQSVAGTYSDYCEPFLAGQGSAYLGTTELDVVRMALGEIGETTTVVSLTAPTTKGEKLATLFYATVRDRLLGGHDWTWATRRQPLADATETRTGWSFCYYPPSDLLKVIDFDGQPAGQTRYRIEANDSLTGRIICCDVPEATLIYVAQASDPALWSPDFLDAMVWALASRLVMPMAVKPDLASRAVAMAEKAWDDAVAGDANEGNPPKRVDSEFITGRSW